MARVGLVLDITGRFNMWWSGIWQWLISLMSCWMYVCMIMNIPDKSQFQKRIFRAMSSVEFKIMIACINSAEMMSRRS
ncbi:hypothetical protein MY9_0264 [Bacillus sp. JS]|nr:hypothetical protein MY9_0264 [Bacillus sp. JS]